MNNSEYNQFLADTLLMPFVDTDFTQNDLLCNYVGAYSRLVCDAKLGSEENHKKSKADLNASRKSILRRFSADSRWGHFDDAQMLVDAFYPGYKLLKFYDQSNNDLGRFYLQHIIDVSRTFITFRDGIASIRSWSDDNERLLNNYDGLHKIELWNYVTRTMPPDLFISAAYINFGVTDPNLLVNVPNLLSRSTNPEKLRFPKLGLVYHFIKQNDCDNFSGYSCIVNDRSKEFDCVDYSTMRILNIRFAEALKKLIEKYPLISDYIIGIDAASLENSAEPWVFAPIFRQFRPSNYVLPVSLKTGERINNIGLTYHVGEDFRHIVSGLRHIDEVLTHFNYCSGDRLGHAVALGVNIERLFAQNRVVVLPIMEHLENLLWIWSKSRTTGISSTLQNLEFQVLNTAKKIYSDIDGISVYLLWQVYNEKFKLLDSGKIAEINRDSLCVLYPQKSTKKINWNIDTLLCSNFCPCRFEDQHKPIFVRISDEEIEMCKNLQKELRSKVENLGIYVETNPSSNLAISDIESVFSHPILNLNCSGLGMEENSDTCVLTTINSDDPIIFSTNVENEISYIYYGLLNAGCKREKVLNWIDKIRMHGISSTFVKYDKQYNEMLNDFDEIQGYIIDY